jgi:hypothetical protein
MRPIIQCVFAHLQNGLSYISVWKFTPKTFYKISSFVQKDETLFIMRLWKLLK